MLAIEHLPAVFTPDGPARLSTVVTMSVTEPLDQRQRILDAALHLMAERGVHAMSMRTLAAACGLNVATLYHYFPSKADLLAEVVRQQDYAALLAPIPPIDAGLPPQRPAGRAAALDLGADGGPGRHVATAARREPARRRRGHGLGRRAERDVRGRARSLDRVTSSPICRTPARSARVLRGLVYGFFIEYLPLPYDDRMRYLAQRADEIAEALPG